ncbi:MAG: heme NO-binding domain-containing protein [Pseudomonadota bacterium]
MHGLINRSIQSFVTHTYGLERWLHVVEDARLSFSDFEAMLIYEDRLTTAVLQALCLDLNRPQCEVLEDIGTFLVSNPNVESLRRLLRFGGETYYDFLHSLDELPDRARLAVSDLHLPPMDLLVDKDGRFQLICGHGLPGFGWVMVGILRAMADDYGALVFLEHQGESDDGEVIAITLVEADFARGRDFDLGARAG